MTYMTEGERLFSAIRDDALRTGSSWRNLGDVVGSVGGTKLVADCLRGAVAIHAVRRLLRFWSAKREFIVDESMYVPTISRFIIADLFPGLDRSVVTRIAR